MTMIEVEGLSKSYGETVAVDEARLQVEEGEIFGILGRNGAGKTTLVECIQGLRAPDRGRVRVMGLDPHSDRQQLRQVLGAQLQQSRLPAKLRVSGPAGRRGGQCGRDLYDGGRPRPSGAIVLTVTGFVIAILVGSLPALVHNLVWGEPEWVTLLLRGVGVTAIAVVILYRVRHTLARQTAAGLGLERRWMAAVEAPVGLVLGAAVVVTADWIAVSLGVMDWRPGPDLAADLTLVVVIGAVLVPLIQEAIPEELWFRGHLYDTLSKSFGVAAVIVLTAVVFGVLHIASEPPEGLTERLLYAVMAIAFGLLLVSGRHVTGSLWLPIGLHAGHNAFMHRLVDVDAGSYSQQLLVRAATMFVFAVALLAVWRLGERSRGDHLRAGPQ